MYTDDILMKNKLDIMTEASKTMDYSTHDSVLSSTYEDAEIELEMVSTLSEDITYSFESIPVILQEGVYGNKRYLVEYDMLNKLLESYDITEREAMDALAETNKIDYDDLYLVIESADYYKEVIDEAKTIGGNSLKGRKTNNLIKSIDDLKAQGIKVFKKKSNKKKKKKKRGRIEITAGAGVSVQRKK